MLAALLLGAPPAAQAQMAERIAVTVDARTEGKPAPDAVATRLLADVTRALAALPDVDVVPREGARRTIWIVTGATPGSIAASVIVTEHYDRETLMVLGIEDDDMAGRMMALQIVVDHQIFTGRGSGAIATRIVSAMNDGLFARLRSLKPRP